ncbi:MAG TPA: glycosyltransferase [Candidatus Krumholzibacteria bacterium]
MRVLSLLYCYPPLLVPASICYAKLMAGLRAAGVEIEIVTIDPEFFDSPAVIPHDETLAAALDHDIVNHVIKSPELSFLVRTVKRLDPDRRWSYRWLEPRKREWTFAAMRALRKLDLSRFDLILSCSQPHANHLLGLEMQRRSGLPWVAYFSDPWTDSPYARYPSEKIRQYNRALEDSVLAAADLVLFTCEEMRQFVVDSHPAWSGEKSGVLPHAFVPRWYGSDAMPRERLANTPFRLLHTGSFYGPRTPLPLIESLERVAAEVELAGKIRIDSYGGMDPAYGQRIERAELAEVFAVHDFVPYLSSLSLMRDHDGLLLIDAPLKSTAESIFLPSKLIDYLGSGRPVVAVTPARGATARVVRETGGIVCPLEEPQRLDGLLRELASGGGLQASSQSAAVGSYDFRQVGDSLAREMQGLLAQPH